MNVIFTDIDGVLNPHWKTKWSKKSIDIYNTICKEFDLVPVITSTWRIHHDINTLQNIFNDQGIETPIHDYTPLIEGGDRGLEIKEWLSKNKVNKYLVIDDKVSNIIPYVNNVVQCRSWIGLSMIEYKEIKKIMMI